MASATKEVKDIGWDHINLTQKGFKGAVQSYKAENGSTVALAFNMHEAFIVEDDQGLFGKDDLVAGIVKAKGINIEMTGEIIGAHVVAWEEEGEMGFDEIKLAELGLDAFEVRESLKARLTALAKLDVMIDMQL